MAVCLKNESVPTDFSKFRAEISKLACSLQIISSFVTIVHGVNFYMTHPFKAFEIIHDYGFNALRDKWMVSLQLTRALPGLS